MSSSKEGPHSIISMNIQGLYPNSNQTKPGQLANLMEEEKAIALCLSETWLHPDMLDAEVLIEGFVLFRADRLARTRGGAAIYLREDLAATIMLEFSNDAVEIVGVKIDPTDTLLICVYRPPDTEQEEWDSAMVALGEAVTSAQGQGKFSTIIMTGDFNLPEIDWVDIPSAQEDSRTGRKGRAAQSLLSFMEDHFLAQVVLSPTRGDNILDLVFTNREELISHTEVRPTTVLSDHSILVSVLTVGPGPKPSSPPAWDQFTTTIPFYDTKSASQEDWNKFGTTLNLSSWADRSSGCSLSQKSSLLSSLIEEAVMATFPRKKSRTKGNRIPLVMRKLMRRRKTVARKLALSRTPDMVLLLRQELFELETTIANSHMEYIRKEEQKAVERCKTDPAYFFQYSRKKSVLPAAVGPLSLPDGAVTTDDLQWRTSSPPSTQRCSLSPLSPAWRLSPGLSSLLQPLLLVLQ